MKIRTLIMGAMALMLLLTIVGCGGTAPVDDAADTTPDDTAAPVTEDAAEDEIISSVDDGWEEDPAEVELGEMY